MIVPLLAIALTAAEPDWLIQSHEPPVFEINADQARGYKNTGTIILRDPVYGFELGRYQWVSGGYGRGSIPFGTYEIGAFRDVDDDPLHIGPRWMLRQPGKDDGETYDARIHDTRTEIELHRAHVFGRDAGTLGCVGVLVDRAGWRDFMANLNRVLAQMGKVTFTIRSAG